MRDLDDFAYLKQIGPFINELRDENGGRAVFSVRRGRFEEFSSQHGLDELQSRVVELILAEWGVTFA